MYLMIRAMIRIRMISTTKMTRIESAIRLIDAAEDSSLQGKLFETSNI